LFARISTEESGLAAASREVYRFPLSNQKCAALQSEIERTIWCDKRTGEAAVGYWRCCGVLAVLWGTGGAVGYWRCRGVASRLRACRDR
jgi:hypothetical protein